MEYFSSCRRSVKYLCIYNRKIENCDKEYCTPLKIYNGLVSGTNNIVVIGTSNGYARDYALSYYSVRV